MVARHPETVRKLLFVNPGFTTHSVRLSAEESRPLPDVLFNLIATKH